MATTETNDSGAAVRMQERLKRMTDAERTELETLLAKDENVRRVASYALGAPPDELRELAQLMEADLAQRRSTIAINGIRLDPATGKRVYTAIAGDHCFTAESHCFDEVPYRIRDGFWFLVRPLAPDEAREWLANDRHDPILARELFVDDED